MNQSPGNTLYNKVKEGTSPFRRETVAAHPSGGMAPKRAGNNTTGRIRNGLLCLLRQGLWSRPEETAGCFPLTADEWEKLYALARKQAVQGIVYEGMLLLPVSLYPPKPLLLQWTANIDQWERINRHQLQVLCALKEFFDREPRLPFEVVKGPSLSCFYPNPLRRVCGDLDLYFGSRAQAEEANRRIEQAGVRVERGKTGDSGYTVHQVMVEHHSRLVELHNPFFQRWLREWEKSVFCTGKPERRPVYHGVPMEVPVPAAHHLLVATHILKHLLNEGIGLRQLCDAAISLKALHADTDPKELARLCKRTGVYRWCQVLYALLAKYLGLPEEYLPFPPAGNPDLLMEEIWESGNFGFYDERKAPRPDGKWQNKWYTSRQISRKARLFFCYAPGETFWWPTLLAATRIKELAWRR